MRYLLILLIGSALAQEKHSAYEVIPVTNDSATGTLKFKELRTNGTDSVIIKGPTTLAADYTMTLPATPTDGFVYFDSVTGLLSFTGAGTCGVDCMTLTTNQTAAGIKTFTNGIIMNGTSYVPTSQFLQVGSAGGVGCVYSGGNITCTNGSGVTRLLIDQASGGSTVSGTIRTFNATDTISSVDVNGTFSAIGFKVGTFASKITIVDAAGLVTPVSFQLTTGATNGFCLVSDAAGVGTWQSCAAGGSFITTNTTQMGLTGDKDTAGTWVWGTVGALSTSITNAGILTILNGSGVQRVQLSQGGGTGSTSGSVTVSNATGTTSSLNSNGVSTAFDMRLYDATLGATFWRWKFGSTSNSIALDSGSGAQRELDVQVFSATDTQWVLRGTLIPGSIGGANGDIGTTGSKWRDGYFSGTMNAPTVVGSLVQLTGLGAAVQIGSGRAFYQGGGIQGWDPTITNIEVSITWANPGGSISTSSNAGTFHNRLDSSGILTNVGYSVGTLGSPITVIDNVGNAVFSTLRVTTSPTAGYVLTADASGNATWQAAAAGSFITTNTVQVGLLGNKSTSGIWTYTGGIVVQASSTARNWTPESDAAYTLGTAAARWLSGAFSGMVLMGDGGTGVRIENSAGITTWYNASNVQRVQISQAGGASTVSGSIFTANASGITNQMNTSGINTTIAYLVNGVSAIDSSRNGSFVNVTASGSGSVIGGVNFTGAGGVSGISALSIAGGFQAASVIVNTGLFTYNRPGGAVTTGHCLTALNSIGDAAWAACGSGSFITSNSAQTGMSGNKDTSGTWTWGTVGALSTDITNAGILTIRNGSGVQRVQLSQAGGGAGVSGSVSVSNSGGVTSKMDNGGVSSTVGYTANGLAGSSGTLTVRNSAGSGTCTITVTFGLITGSTC